MYLLSATTTLKNTSPYSSPIRSSLLKSLELANLLVSEKRLHGCYSEHKLVCGGFGGGVADKNDERNENTYIIKLDK